MMTALHRALSRLIRIAAGTFVFLAPYAIIWLVPHDTTDPGARQVIFAAYVVISVGLLLLTGRRPTSR
jgi:hypothetical protein